MTQLGLEDMRRYAVARSLFAPTTLGRAIEALGFVQADPIRAPARAQDLTLRHRVAGYRAGDLERRYAELAVEEDFFVNYGFLPRACQALMHPRRAPHPLGAARTRRARALLAFVRERGEAHPREVDARFAHGRVTNGFGGSSAATTQLLDALHYRGALRIARREGGVRVYAVRERPPPVAGAAERRARLDALVDLAVQAYAPLPAPTLRFLVNRLQYAAPQWRNDLHGAFERARRRLARARVDDLDWYWPAGEDPASARDAPEDELRLLAPFDPVVWDRRRFGRLWGWAYRFEAYTPPARRQLGYYALPLLWRAHVIGWGNLALAEGRLRAELGYVAGRAPRDPAFRRALELELERFARFLDVARGATRARLRSRLPPPPAPRPPAPSTPPASSPWPAPSSRS
jgi:hypothetical protein